MTQPWEWDEPTWRGHVQRVRAGRSLKPESWPGGARVAVALSFDADHETIPLRDADLSPCRLSQGEYGSRTAVPRVLRLLAEHGIPATFFVPAVSGLLHPEDLRLFVDAGHEVALHGWIHERNTDLPPGVERELALRSADTLERLTGRRPVGLRTPSWDFSADTLSIVRELGLAYDSSLMADDEPYELLADGQPTGVVEIPVEWIRDDAPFFPRDPTRPNLAPRDVLRLWCDEFDGAHAEGGLFQLTMHPHVIGHRGRLVALRELIGHVLGHQDVWWASHPRRGGRLGQPLTWAGSRALMLRAVLAQSSQPLTTSPANTM
ncbi:polysaccharide deacetylase family protein [Kutzneria albida]|uniref:polysaccharide deacetylase family protein n=1 Tax=Kutzneria albida TaxID=43357 RepID=UPI00046CAC8B|nr:polysaccharide deacetylase [Kutzneria albida]